MSYTKYQNYPVVSSAYSFVSYLLNNDFKKLEIKVDSTLFTSHIEVWYELESSKDVSVSDVDKKQEEINLYLKNIKAIKNNDSVYEEHEDGFYFRTNYIKKTSSGKIDYSLISTASDYYAKRKVCLVGWFSLPYDITDEDLKFIHEKIVKPSYEILDEEELTFIYKDIFLDKLRGIL